MGIDVLLCSFLKKNKLVIKEWNSSSLCMLTLATRTSCVYNICSTLRDTREQMIPCFIIHCPDYYPQERYQK